MRHLRLPPLPLSLLLALSAVSGAGCQSPTDVERLVERTDHAEALWLARRPVAYEAVQSRHCECLPEMAGPVRLSVTRRQGAITPSNTEAIIGITYESSGEAVPNELRPYFYSAQGLFELIRSAVRDGAADIEVEFDSELGYPRRVFIDVDAQSADEELSYDFELVSQD